MGGVNDLGGTDGGQIAVALIGEHQSVLAHGALDAGGHCGSAAMSGLVHVAVEVVIGKHGTADGGYTDDLAIQVHLIDDLGHQTVNNTVVAAGAVMELLVTQQLCLFKQYSHLIYPPSCSGSSQRSHW